MERRKKVAREVFDIYAPLAHRLGIGHLKWELEDISFRYLEPDVYMQIASLLDEKRLDREQFRATLAKTAIDGVCPRVEPPGGDAVGDFERDLRLAGRVGRDLRQPNHRFGEP